MPPPLDLSLEKKVQAAVRAMVRAGLLRSAHDSSDGGLGVALAEMCFARDLGCTIDLPASSGRKDALLFGEDASRIVVAFPPSASLKVAAIAREHGVPFAEIGEVGGGSLVVKHGGKPLLEVRVADAKEPWTKAIPRLVGEGIHQVALEGR
jgi:phosphoribosylformylglycinamidine synthase